MNIFNRKKQFRIHNLQDFSLTTRFLKQAPSTRRATRVAVVIWALKSEFGTRISFTTTLDLGRGLIISSVLGGYSQLVACSVGD